MKDLKTLPKGMDIPTRHRAEQGSRSIGNTILVAKGDFDYIEQRKFKGRFTILNKHSGNHTTAYRLAVALENNSTICLSIAQERRTTKMPDGATWRTVRLVSAYKTEDGKLCVIEIEPLAAKGGEA
jgi:hypothetical protein